nr:immunoglobulin heavy chain junction region [Macaca mulatta]MOW76698.1 immunoglobulin heavy chain junction region [Macaca mulatta]MOW76751.1 immunoglobulin heavy chain junction region [Macaca mulatta]MOW77266.1 immunoglobulin heavy chain junction region [Macaca mulatta]MOW77649.1 immunoglobulin heavy chain junction region [Macaca mulatta]
CARDGGTSPRIVWLDVW